MATYPRETLVHAAAGPESLPELEWASWSAKLNMGRTAYGFVVDHVLWIVRLKQSDTDRSLTSQSDRLIFLD